MLSTNPHIIGFHAHVYFDLDQVEQARNLCERAAQQFDIRAGRVLTRPVGPHPMPSCQLSANPTNFGRLLPWLIENRQTLTVFCHAITGDDLEDHTRNVFWLGEPQALNLSMFLPSKKVS